MQSSSLLHRCSCLLAPLSFVYGAAASLRNWGYDSGVLPSEHPGLKTICVGNATAGGSGKSPVSQHVTALLMEMGKRPALLSRGYGGALAGPHLLSEGDSAEDVGDEPLMHFRAFDGRVPVMIARDRLSGAKQIKERNLGDVIVLDDGYQHRRLRRDLNILLLDATSKDSVELWRTGKLLPRGRLREPLSSAMQRASCLILVKRTSVPANTLSFEEFPDIIPPQIPVFHFVLSPDSLSDLSTGASLPLDFLHGKKITAFSGIAAPDGFLEMLESLGANISVFRRFPDHHRYTVEDLRSLLEEGPSLLITTAKDAVKLELGFLDLAQNRILSLNLQGSFASNNEALRFQNLLKGLFVEFRRDGSQTASGG